MKNNRVINTHNSSEWIRVGVFGAFTLILFFWMSITGLRPHPKLALCLTLLLISVTMTSAVSYSQVFFIKEYLRIITIAIVITMAMVIGSLLLLFGGEIQYVGTYILGKIYVIKTPLDVLIQIFFLVFLFFLKKIKPKN